MGQGREGILEEGECGGKGGKAHQMGPSIHMNYRRGRGGLTA